MDAESFITLTPEGKAELQPTLLDDRVSTGNEEKN
jgi:hypothetical protein